MLNSREPDDKCVIGDAASSSPVTPVEAVSKNDVSIGDVKQAFWDEKSPQLALNTVRSYALSLKKCETLMGPTRIAMITTDWLSSYGDKLTRDGLATETVKTHLERLCVFLRWCHHKGYLRTLPKFNQCIRKQSIRPKRFCVLVPPEGWNQRKAMLAAAHQIRLAFEEWPCGTASFVTETLEQLMREDHDGWIRANRRALNESK